ncbi:MAG: hypothetical protein GY856_14775 [bacterium]|nr:hypothetical protein [bacterium]
MSEPHSDATDALAAAVNDLALAARRQKGREISVEELQAYLDGELSREAEEELKNQLALDPEATNTLLGMMAFRKRVAAGADAEAPVADWQAMQELIEDDEEIGAGVAAAAGAGPSRLARPAVLHLWQIAAAVFLVTTVGIFFWGQHRVQQLTEQVSDAHRPRINVFQNDLRPVALELQRDPGQGQTIVLEAETERYVVALNIADPGDYPDYGVELLKISEDGEVRVWGARGLEPSPAETFNVELHRDFLPEGSYQVQLFGMEGDRKELLEAYHVHIMVE